MKQKAFIRTTLCLIAALSVMVEAACSIQGSTTQAAAATVQPASQTQQNTQAGSSQTGNTADSTGSQNPSVGQATSASPEVGGTGLYNLSGGEVTKTNETLSATMDDQSAVIVSGGSVLTMTGMKIGSAGNSSSMESSNFYGLNAAVLDRKSSEIKLSDSTVSTTGTGANGVFATGEDAKIDLESVNITTAGDNAAGIATGSGGGTITVNGGNVVTTGAKSPAIYLTGNCTFTMTDGSLTAAQGPLFYSANTTAQISLNNVTLSGTGDLLLAGADQWGNSGSNGSQVILSTDGQKMSGDLVADSISSADISLQNGSSLAGAINKAKTAKSVTLSMDKNSTWNVTENSYLTALTDADSTLSNITGNGHTVYYNSTNNANAWLGGRTVSLADGGSLKPMQ